MLFVNLFWCVVWAKICPQLHVTVHALHSWILCNCQGPLLNPVPGNLIFTAAPDRNHLAVLIRLYWNWKIAAALYVVLNSMSNFEFSVVWSMSQRHFWATLKTWTAYVNHSSSLKMSLYSQNDLKIIHLMLTDVPERLTVLCSWLYSIVLHSGDLMNLGEVGDLMTQTQAFSPKPKNL